MIIATKWNPPNISNMCYKIEDFTSISPEVNNIIINYMQKIEI